MLDIKNLNKAIEHIAAERDLDEDKIREAVEAALASAYKKEFDRKGEIIRAALDRNSGKIKFNQIKIVIDKDSVRMREEEEHDEKKNNKQNEENGQERIQLYNESRHIFINEAKKIKKDVKVGDELIFDLPDPPEEFGRISAQTAKQVILQRIREIEKEVIRNEFQDKIGELVSGVVQRIERGSVYVDLGKAMGIMGFSESIPGEHYRIGERLRFYLVDVKDTEKNPTLLLSRTHPKFVSKLFELEVPEIADGIVVIKNIEREAGSRTKVSVYSTVEGVDPVGACVGQRGARVMAVNSELFNERLDIVEWSEDPVEYISSALSPAVVSSVKIIPPNVAKVLVSDDNLSLAIGKGGQNVRLAAKLTGWKIDVRSQSNPEEIQEDGVAEIMDAENNKADDFDKENNGINKNISKETDLSDIDAKEQVVSNVDDEVEKFPNDKTKGFSGNDNLSSKKDDDE